MKGLEVYLKRDAEKLSYSLAYTLSKSERRYREINGGSGFLSPMIEGMTCRLPFQKLLEKSGASMQALPFSQAIILPLR